MSPHNLRVRRHVCPTCLRIIRVDKQRFFYNHLSIDQSTPCPNSKKAVAAGLSVSKSWIEATRRPLEIEPLKIKGEL